MIRLTRTNAFGVVSTLIADQKLSAIDTPTTGTPFCTILPYQDGTDSVFTIIEQTPFGGKLEIAFEEAA